VTTAPTSRTAVPGVNPTRTIAPRGTGVSAIGRSWQHPPPRPGTLAQASAAGVRGAAIIAG
jgi:hypothetical protein